MCSPVSVCAKVLPTFRQRRYGYKREWYEDTIDICFEGVQLRGARKYDEYLHFLYGDYLVLPPEEKRKTHPVSAISFDGILKEDMINEKDNV